MTDTEKTATEAAEFYSGVAAEFLQHYVRGPRFVAVTGVPDADEARVADAFAAALRDAGQEVERAGTDAESGADAFREGVVAPFRARDGVLVVDGRGLLNPAFRGFWNFSLWVDHDPDRDPDWTFVSSDLNQLGSPREAASVMLDGTDPERPRRLWADFC